jgi:hypothetical protein
MRAGQARLRFARGVGLVSVGASPRPGQPAGLIAEARRVGADGQVDVRSCSARAIASQAASSPPVRFALT